jgi:hypothetical protein
MLRHVARPGDVTLGKEPTMAKGQLRSNKETKKQKQPKKPAAPTVPWGSTAASRAAETKKK